MMYSPLIRLAFAFAFTANGVFGHGRRLGYVENDTNTAEDWVDSEDTLGCGSTTPSLEDRFDVAMMMRAWKANGRKLSTTSYTIPVHFWHTYSPGTTPLTYQSILDDHFATLNFGFRDTPFRFELRGIEIVESSEYGACVQRKDSEYKMKSELRIEGKNVLNVYICDSRQSTSGAWSSYAVEADINPLNDGVVLRSPNLLAPNRRGNAIYNIIHEVGHWMGLMHTFEGGCSPRVINDMDGNVVSGDDVADTPAHFGGTQDLPGEEVCWLFDPPLDTCSDSIPGIDKGVDPVNNFMNYNSGRCKELYGEFTPGQIERMIIQFETYRLDNICRAIGVSCVESSQCCDGVCLGEGVTKKKTCKATGNA